MTIRLKTMKTADLDVQGESAQQFLQQMEGSLAQDEDVDASRTKITQQQKVKFFMHWIILITVHVFVFWFIPITGNYRLYGSAYCRSAKNKLDESRIKLDGDQSPADTTEYAYGCRNFQDSGYLQIFYILWVCYLYKSAQ